MSEGERWARWCFDTCMLHGCDPALASRVTAIFSDAVAKSYKEGDEQ